MSNIYKIAAAVTLTILVCAFGITVFVIALDSSRSAREARISKEVYSEIQSILNLNICAGFSELEQASLDAAKSNPEAFRYTLAMIHYDRVGTWTMRLTEAEEQLNSATSEYYRERIQKKVDEYRNNKTTFHNTYAQILNPTE